MSRAFLKHLRNHFLTGLLVVLPVFISIKIFLWLFNFAIDLTNWVLVLLPKKLRAPEPLGGLTADWYNFVLKLLAFVLTLLFIALVGVVAKNVFGKRILNYSEALLLRVPLLNKIYATVKQITQTVWTGQKTIFQEVVIIEYPRPGLYTVGFVTSTTKGEIQTRTRETVVNVFVPTVPNPTSGFLVMVPKEQLIHLDMSVADGFKLIISGGAVVPPYPPPQSAEPQPVGGAQPASRGFDELASKASRDSR